MAFGDVSMGMPTSNFGVQGPSAQVGPAGQSFTPTAELPMQNAAQPPGMMDSLKSKLGELGYDDYMDMAQQAMEGMGQGGGGEEQQPGGGIPAMQPGMPLGSVHEMQNHLAPLMGGGGGGGRGGLFG
jgi:hypothetical protein